MPSSEMVAIGARRLQIGPPHHPQRSPALFSSNATGQTFNQSLPMSQSHHSQEQIPAISTMKTPLFFTLSLYFKPLTRNTQRPTNPRT
ncbi:hypothetical protein COLO4_25454 [Corchorus olitorius]|uniref:Uncharacterized protein n=1 Tax=Corchorus olitorius TaxID=93759 RepID=A0A1R3I2G4_9ROSI|nr:hypothetical protein COLO4_25454 [Corchorus olitorius]